MLASRTRLLRWLTVLGVVVGVASIATAASAAQRYASPTGSGVACTSASPCTIVQAVGNAITGDEVIVNPGDYPLTQTLAEAGYKGGLAKITIHGVAGLPRPRLLFSGPGQRGVALEGGSTLRGVEIDQASPDRALFAGGGADIDEVVATAHGDTGVVAAQIRDATIRNSVVVVSGAHARALSTGSGSGPPVTATYRNVTAAASGTDAVAIEAVGATGASVTAHLINVIAYGGSSALPIRASTDSSNGATATMTVTHSVYASWDVTGAAAKILDGGGNRWEKPAFVNAAAGDYHQAPGSYTIDAGLNDLANGNFDLDGDPRALGTTDIGADEFVPAPTATPPSPSPPATTSPSSTVVPPPGFAGVQLVSTRLRVARGLIAVTLRCPAGTVGRCSGQTRLTVRRRMGSRAGSTVTVTLGRAPFSIAPGKQAKVNVRVSRVGRRLLGRARLVRGQDTNVARDGAGTSKTTVARVAIRRR